MRHHTLVTSLGATDAFLALCFSIFVAQDIVALSLVDQPFCWWLHYRMQEILNGSQVITETSRWGIQNMCDSRLWCQT